MSECSHCCCCCCRRPTASDAYCGQCAFAYYRNYERCLSCGATAADRAVRVGEMWCCASVCRSHAHTLSHTHTTPRAQEFVSKLVAAITFIVAMAVAVAVLQ